MAACVGAAQFQVGLFGQIVEAFQVADHGRVAAPAGLEERAGISAKDLHGGFQEEATGGRQDAADGETSVLDAGVRFIDVPSHQVEGHQRPVNPGQGVVVHFVGLAEGRAHFSHPHQEAARHRREGEVALFYLHTFFAEGQEEVGARKGVNDGLKRDLAFLQREEGHRIDAVAPGRAGEVADDADVGIEHFRAGADSGVNG